MCNECNNKCGFNHEISSIDDLIKYKEYLEKELEITIKTLKDIKEEANEKKG